jgi:hypothetical protein
VRIEEATAFTLFGSVVTGEQVGAVNPRSSDARFSLPLI